MTQAEVYLSKANYDKIDLYEKAYPSFYERLEYPVGYEMKFQDGSECKVVLTNRQRNGLPRARYNILTTGGLGYQQRKLKL